MYTVQTSIENHMQHVQDNVTKKCRLESSLVAIIYLNSKLVLMGSKESITFHNYLWLLRI